MDTNIYKTKLESEASVVEKELSDIAQLNKTTGQWEAVPEAEDTPEADMNDMADRAEDYEERSSMVRTLQSRLNDIDRALEKIENGTYGICDICGGEIEADRLEANPAAHTCKACMEKE